MVKKSVKKGGSKFAKPVVKRRKKMTDAIADKNTEVPETLPPYLTKMACERCNDVRTELVTSLRRSIEKMTEIAANGKGHDHEGENSTEYNRYFGAAIAADTMLKEYFGFPKTEKDAAAVVEEEAKAE